MPHDSNARIKREETVDPLPTGSFYVGIFPRNHGEVGRQPQSQPQAAIGSRLQEATSEDLAHTRRLPARINRQQECGERPSNGDEPRRVQFPAIEFRQAHLQVTVIEFDAGRLIRRHLASGRLQHSHLEGTEASIVRHADREIRYFKGDVVVVHGPSLDLKILESLLAWPRPTVGISAPGTLPDREFCLAGCYA